MNGFRLLSTKVLSPNQRMRLVNNGVSYSEWNFIQIIPKTFKADISNKVLLFTSQNAVNAVLSQIDLRDQKCYCVGEKTKSILVKNGAKVLKMEQNASILADFVLKNAENEDFLFFAGNIRMPHLEAAFSKANIPLEVITVYETISHPKKMGFFDGILFFSPSGVDSFLTSNSVALSQCFAIGSTTAIALKPHTNNIITASKPSVEHLTAAVKTHLTTIL